MASRALGKSIPILGHGGWLNREPENWDDEEIFRNIRYVSADVWRLLSSQPGLTLPKSRC